jgi:two-component system response regulator RegX3
MPKRERDPVRHRVLVAAPDGSGTTLQSLAPELEVICTDPGEVTRRTLDLQPRVVVVDDPDAARGLRSVRALRNARTGARILFITPPEAELERLDALEAGVDEAIACPLAASELAGRIRLLLRRSRGGRRSRLPIGGTMELDLDRRELLRDGAWVHLRPKEARLLELFARSPGKVLSRQHILERVWGPDHDGDPRTVDVHVRWLRAKLEPDPHAPTWLLTIRGVGYRLETAPLTER